MRISGRRVLVTGADGFIGSHLAERLVQHGAEVVCLAQYNSFSSAGWLDTLQPETRKELDIQFGDVRDAGRVNDLVTGIDAVFHLAALIAIPYSYQAPQSFVDTNVTGTLNVLEAARRLNTENVIVTSTSEVYGTPSEIPITEGNALQAQSPYAATKIAGDQLALSYAAAFDLNVLVLRPFNTYGPRQSMRAVIPTILTQMLASREEIHLGSLHPRRDFTFVTDTVDGFVKAAEAETSPGEVIQLGTGQAVSVGELVEICRSITGSTARVVASDERVRPEASEVQVLLSDPTRAGARLGWSPTTSLQQGLQLTAQWVAQDLNIESAGRYHR